MSIPPDAIIVSAKDPTHLYLSMSGGGTFTPRLDAAYTDAVYASAVNAP